MWRWGGGPLWKGFPATGCDQEATRQGQLLFLEKGLGTLAQCRLAWTMSMAHLAACVPRCPLRKDPGLRHMEIGTRCSKQVVAVGLVSGSRAVPMEGDAGCQGMRPTAAHGAGSWEGGREAGAARVSFLMPACPCGAWGRQAQAVCSLRLTVLLLAPWSQGPAGGLWQEAEF